MEYEKAYKEAIESIKRIYDQADSYGKELMEKEFPELKESEDERIRKGLIKGLSAMRDIHKHQTFSDDAINIDDAIAWLEKQGEKSVVKIEPIKEGLTDFQRCVSCLIASVMNKEYDYTQGFVEWAAQTLLGYAKHEIKTAWREEDENMLNDIIRGLKSVEHLIFTHNAQGRTQLQGRIDWLKSLKPHWKPNDLQLEALESAYKQLPNIQYFLQSLYNDLKKL